MSALGYEAWHNFQSAIERAKDSCATFGKKVDEHFNEVVKVSQNQFGPRTYQDYYLSRYACYLIAQNGDPKKEKIAAAQAYFAYKTHQQELAEQADPDVLRISLRQKVKEQHKSLSSVAKRAGVTAHGLFNDNGYKGLYGGRGIRDIHIYKQIPLKENLMDRIGPAELAANFFRMTQCEERLDRVLETEGVCGQAMANQIHGDAGRAVRKAIEAQGNTLPEKLPAYTHIRKLISERKKNARKQLTTSP